MARTKKVNVETETEAITTRYNDRETCVNIYGNEDYLTIYTCQPKWMNKVRKMIEERPDECTVLYDNGRDGIEVQMPVGCFKFSWPRTMSEENKAKARERGKMLGASRRKKKIETEDAVEVEAVNETDEISEAEETETDVVEADEVETENIEE